MLHGKALVVIEPERSLNCLQFSPHRPLVIAVGGASGNVHVVDLVQGNRVAHVLEADQKGEVTTLEFNTEHKGFIAIGYSSGRVRVFSLAYSLFSQIPDETRRMNVLLEQA